MGRWVLREACRQARQWEREGVRPLPHPVMLANLSANQLRSVDVVQSIEQMLTGADLDVCRLALDVTETPCSRRRRRGAGCWRVLGIWG
jgi:EAL domain-containing protein (putative c-di-GMP-specific phosphodiesterase class I)